MLLLCEAGEGIGLVSPSVMRAPGKSSLYMKIHYKQKAKREKKKISSPSTKRIGLILITNKF